MCSTAGHCHERIAEDVAGLPLIGGGQYMQSYARLPLEIDAATRQVMAGKPEVIANRSAAGDGSPDPPWWPRSPLAETDR